MTNDEDFLLLVRRSPDDSRTAACMFNGVKRLRWDNIAGGLRRITPQPMVFGYVFCDSFIGGSVPHTCARGGPSPHQIKVCVLNELNPGNWERILKMVPESPNRAGLARLLIGAYAITTTAEQVIRSSSVPPCRPGPAYGDSIRALHGPESGRNRARDCAGLGGRVRG